MSVEIISKLMSVHFSRHQTDLPGELTAIDHEMAAKGMLHSGATLTRYAQLTNEKKRQIADAIKPIMESYWRDTQNRDIDLADVVCAEAKDIFSRLDKIVQTKMKSRANSGLPPRAYEEVVRLMDQESDRLLDMIKTSAEIVAAGFSVSPQPIAHTGDVNVSVGSSYGPLMVNSQIGGSINNSVQIINQDDPQLADAIKNLLDALLPIKESEPNKYQECIEAVSGIAEEALKPKAERRKGVLSAFFDFLRKSAQAVRDSTTISDAVSNVASLIT